MKKLDSHGVFEYLTKQGHKMTKEQWIDLNVEGKIALELTQEEVSYINNHSKVSATMGGLSVCA